MMGHRRGVSALRAKLAGHYSRGSSSHWPTMPVATNFAAALRFRASHALRHCRDGGFRDYHIWAMGTIASHQVSNVPSKCRFITVEYDARFIIALRAAADYTSSSRPPMTFYGHKRIRRSRVWRCRRRFSRRWQHDMFLLTSAFRRLAGAARAARLDEESFRQLIDMRAAA